MIYLRVDRTVVSVIFYPLWGIRGGTHPVIVFVFYWKKTDSAREEKMVSGVNGECRQLRRLTYVYLYILYRNTLKNNEGLKKLNSDSNESPPTSLVTGPDVLDLT